MSFTATEDRLLTAKIGLMLRAPFFGNLASRMKLVEASSWCDTAATDGRSFFYNTEFIEKLSVRNLEFLFGHEILHCALDHFGRTGNRHPKLANIAKDFAVNQILVDERIGDKITIIDICQDDQYRDMAWEDIYDLLLEKGAKMDMQELLDMLGDLLDEHLSPDVSDNDNPNAPTMQHSQMQGIRDEIKEAMLLAMSAAGAGSVPKGISRLLLDLTEPKMNWRDHLQLNIQSTIRTDYSYARPNKKGWSSGVTLPGLIPDQAVEVAVALDMSGSIGLEDATAFLSEVQGIMQQYASYAIDLWCFDSEVHNHKKITQDNVYEFETYEPKGGGGTSFEANFEWMAANSLNPKIFIMFTDGYPNYGWGDESYCDTIFLIKGNTSIEAPFGQTLHYEKL
jgi:predicted metal-dependent peptidase